MKYGKAQARYGIKFLLIIFFCLFSLSYRLNAQVVITGRITDIASHAPLYPATVLDKTTGEATYADSSGYYRIVTAPGDTLMYSYLGFYTQIYVVPVRLVRIIHDVQLISKREKLSEVEIRAITPYQRDSLDRIKTFKYFMDEQEAPLFDQRSHSMQHSPDPHYNDAFGLELHPFSHFSREERRKRHFRKMFSQFEQDAFINSRYTPELVHKLTGLTGDSLSLFLYDYRPTYEFTRYASDLVFWSWIKIHYKSWIRPK
jgi:hypothetical protein